MLIHSFSNGPKSEFRDPSYLPAKEYDKAEKAVIDCQPIKQI